MGAEMAISAGGTAVSSPSTGFSTPVTTEATGVLAQTAPPSIFGLQSETAGTLADNSIFTAAC